MLIRIILNLIFIFLSQSVFASASANYFEKNKNQYPAQTQFFSTQNDTIYGFSARGIDIYPNDGRVKHKISLILARAQEGIKLYGGQRDKKDRFQRLRMSGAFTGIDLQYYFNAQGRLEYDYLLAAKANPEQLRLKIIGADTYFIDSLGRLEIQVSGKHLIQSPPVAYQMSAHGVIKRVAVAYEMVGDSVQYRLGEYDRNKPLIIDPVIEASGLMGGQWDDQATVSVVDSQGNIYIAGATSARARITYKNILSLEDTAMPPVQDVTGTAYYDGQHGISLDNSFINNNVIDLQNGLLLDANGIVLQDQYQYACPYRYSGSLNNDMMVTDYDGFISKYDSNFNLIYTTYLGGCGNDGINAIAIDQNDNLYVAGLTMSDDFPVKSAFQSSLAKSRLVSAPIQPDGFYAKFSKDGQLIYSSYLGGNGADGIRDIAVDANENLYVTGYTHSTDLPTNCTNGTVPVLQCDSVGGTKSVVDAGNTQDTIIYSDAFVAKISSSGNALSFLTYLGGKYDDWGQAIALHNNAIYIAGNTSSPDLPSNGGLYSFSDYHDSGVECSRTPLTTQLNASVNDLHFCADAFLVKLSADGTSLDFSTYFGGALDDNVNDIKVDDSGNIYLVGTSQSQGVNFDLDNPPTFDNDADRQAFQKYFHQSFLLYKSISQFTTHSDNQTNNAFFALFNSDASKLIQSSLIGGSNDDSGIAVQIKPDSTDTNKEWVYIGGHTISDDFYTANTFNPVAQNNDIFLVKMGIDLSQSSTPYSIDNAANRSDPNSCFPTSQNGCGLYSIAYSTLFGGEDLEDLKGLTLTSNGAILTGSTYSRRYPYFGNQLKTSIQGVVERQYDPTTRQIIVAPVVYPSDGYVVKLNDDDVTEDASLSVNVPSSNVTEGDTITYEITVSNPGNNVVSSSNLLITFPYLSDLNTLSNYVNVSLPSSDCLTQLTQIYCTLGNLDPTSTKAVTFTLTTQYDGLLPVNFSLSSLTADNNPSNNRTETKVDVKKKTHSAALNWWVIGIFMVLFPMGVTSRIKQTNGRKINESLG